MRLRLKVLVGALLGLLGAPVVFLAAGAPISGGRTIAAILIFGPVFGAALAFFFDRYGAPVEQPLALSDKPKGVGRVATAGAMAGGYTGVVVYLLGFLPTPWYVLACFGLGGLFVACHWIYANIKYP